MIDNKNLNIPNITVKETVNSLTALYCSAVKANRPFKTLPTPFLWGPAGIGKSEAISQLADTLSRETGKSVSITDVRLLLYSPIDLAGMPVVSPEEDFCKWLKPKMFDMKDDDDHINILFLDELSAASQSVQAAAYQICLDRKVGEHSFPDNCIVVAAGNRTTDQSVSYRMPKALCNRLMHFNITTDFTAWREWAVAHGIDSRIIGYLAFDNSKLCVEPSTADMAYPTPRSWAFASSLLTTLGGSIESNLTLISACIGTESALELSAWAKVNDQLPDVDSVLAGKCKIYPRSHDALYAFMASLVSAISARKERITVDELDRACTYVNRFPVDYATCFYCDLNAIEGLRLKLMKCPASRRWFDKHKNEV